MELSLFCAILHEAFSALPSPDVVRTGMVTIAFAGTGLFVLELARNRQLAVSHLQELEKQIREALSKPGRTEGVRKIAERFGVNPGTVQRISRPFEGAGVGAA